MPTLHIGYGDGEYTIDVERLAMYRRLASIHGESEIGHRYLTCASEVAVRVRVWENRPR